MTYKNIFGAAAIATLTASTAFAGGMAEPVMEMAPDMVMEESESSSAGLLIPLIIIALIAAAASSGGGGNNGLQTLDPGSF